MIYGNNYAGLQPSKVLVADSLSESLVKVPEVTRYEVVACLAVSSTLLAARVTVISHFLNRGSSAVRMGLASRAC
jgi:hypothetical protein